MLTVLLTVSVTTVKPLSNLMAADEVTTRRSRRLELNLRRVPVAPVVAHGTRAVCQLERAQKMVEWRA
jgi:hypothetical protein